MWWSKNPAAENEQTNKQKTMSTHSMQSLHLQFCHLEVCGMRSIQMTSSKCLAFHFDVFVQPFSFECKLFCLFCWIFVCQKSVESSFGRTESSIEHCNCHWCGCCLRPPSAVTSIQSFSQKALIRVNAVLSKRRINVPNEGPNRCLPVLAS